MTSKKTQSTPQQLPRAILVTFLASFISVTIAFFIIIFEKPLQTMIGEDLVEMKAATWLLVFVFILVMRHQLRVIFLDSVYVKSIEINLERVVYWLLLAIATMGSLVFFIFKFGIKIATWYMAVYSALFTVLGICMLGGQSGSPKQRETWKENSNAIFSTIVDLICFAIWAVATGHASSNLSFSGFGVAVVIRLSNSSKYRLDGKKIDLKGPQCAVR